MDAVAIGAIHGIHVTAAASSCYMKSFYGTLSDIILNISTVKTRDFQRFDP